MTNSETVSALAQGDSYVPSPTCPPVHPSPRKPSITLPANSCDSHCHIFGPFDKYPLSSTRTFTPHSAPVEELNELHAFLGIDRAVIVQSSCYGTNNRIMVDALRASGGRLRGEALIDARTTPAELTEMHEAGVRGFRLNYLPHLRAAPTSEEIETLRALVRPFGWHTQVHVEGSGVLNEIEVIKSIDGNIVIDHMGRIDLQAGINTPEVDSILELMDTGRVWIKVSGIDRLSVQGAPYDDAVELAAKLVRHAPERVLWGTDYPHVNMAVPAPDDGLLTDALSRIAPDDFLLRRLLVENPSEFFEFDA